MRDPLRLHLGSGGSRHEGWVNIDLLGPPTDLAWDLRKGIPFLEGLAEAVFHEHLLEHLPLTATLPLLRECRRVLRRGGVLRVGVPDAERYIRDYVRPSGFIATFRPGRPTPSLALAEVAYCYGHLSLWDGSRLCVALAEAGVPARDSTRLWRFIHQSGSRQPKSKLRDCLSGGPSRPDLRCLPSPILEWVNRSRAPHLRNEPRQSSRPGPLALMGT